jgi:threonine aldolase
VFAILPRAATENLLSELPGKDPFYMWDEPAGEVRWMCSWDTTEEDVDAFAKAVAEAVASA